MSSYKYLPNYLVLLVMTCGCGETLTVESNPEPEVQSVVSGKSELSIVVEDSPTEALAEDEPSPDDHEFTDQETSIGYQPPYPDRVDLFLAPKREGRRSTRNDQQDAVELLGFVNVDHQRAVLMINGAVYPVAEGDTRFGIEVISIQPPGVVLQRGRQRWQASLEN